ncbi:MAG TPA: glycoside hydrolase family 2 protein [Terriglobales bacterium]|nr:glycoside hydrolase family 2 protein [Terriglobales bacterium]
MTKNWVLLTLVLLPLPRITFAQAQTTSATSPEPVLTLRDGWTLQSSCKVEKAGELISTPQFSPSGWYTVSVPTTVVAALVKQKIYPDPEFGMNLRQLPGMDYPIGANFSNIPMQQDSPFMVPWWYRKQFSIPGSFRGKTIWLDFGGINYRAKIFLNGKQIAGKDDVAGAWRTYEFNVTDAAHVGGSNVLAVEVYSPTEKDLAITFVDWNPAPPDKNMGLWREVKVRASGPVALRYPTVVSKLDADGKAHLTVTALLKNGTNQPVKGSLKGTIENISFSQEVELGPNERKDVTFDPTQFSQLNVDSPRLWWPKQVGKPELYKLAMDVQTGGKISDASETKFGIREITSELNENGKRVFSINGKKILIRGGGWSPDMMLRENSQRLRDEFDYVQDMGLNTIRLEGKLETKEFFDLADQRGILVMAGWCCCDFWERWMNWSPEDYKIAEQSLRDQIYRLRSHPSLLVWLNGSDNPPPADVEEIYLKVEKELQWPNPVISSATGKPTAVTGDSGVKMSGPYEYVAPDYWMEDSLGANHPQTCNLGGCGGGYGFNTETSPGPAVPPIESIKTMLPKEHWWPIDDWWNFHAGGGEFKDLHVFTDALNARYGTATSLEDYTIKSQAQAYEGIRAMYEAYSRNKYTSGGVIQWMLNNAWTSMIWHLYDWYLRPGGGYFGAKTAMQALDPVYGYDDNAVYVVNSRFEEAKGLHVSIKVLNLDMTEKFSNQSTVDVPSDGVVKVVALPQISGLSPTYFLALRITNADGNPLGSNFYWLSTKQETIDWAHSQWYVTPTLSYADFTDLSHLPKVKLDITERSQRQGENEVTQVTLENPSKNLAFFVRLKVDKGKGGDEILPVLWQDNYVSLLPGEKREISATYHASALGTTKPAVEVSGFNLE